MDLHGNVLSRFSRKLDLITCLSYGTSQDALDSKEAGVENLLDRLGGLEGKHLLSKAFGFLFPILLPR